MNDRRHLAAGNLSHGTPRIDLLEIAALVASKSRVLDIGCGEGTLLRLLQSRRGVDGQGMELSQSGVNACVAQGLAVVQGDANKDLIYYPDARFDVVILSQTLQAVVNPQAVLREMARIGGRLIVSIPNFGHWRLRLSLLLRGQMPVTPLLDASWYETANIHLCSLIDFVDLCDTLDLHVEKTITLRGKHVRHNQGAPSHWANLTAELAVFVLRHD